MKRLKAMNNKLLGAALALLFAFPASSLAQVVVAPAPQQPQQTGPVEQTTKGAVIKGRAPVNKEVLKVKLPRPQEATLPNGLRVVLLERHKVPTFTMQMVFFGGGLADPADYRGLAQFTATLLREGTATRSSREIAEQVETLGSTLAASAGLASYTSSVSTSGLAENLDPVMGIFADVIRNPKFPQSEVDKFKTRTLALQQFQRANVQFLASERLYRAIYGEHPAGTVVAPPESIRRLTSEDLARFHAANYRPNNAILAVVGDVTMKELMQRVERAFGDWQKGEVQLPKIPAVPAQNTARVYLVDRPGSVQTVLQLAAVGIERTSPDYFALAVANRVLGGGASARLFLNLREEHGYTYGAYSSFGAGKFPGMWLSYADVKTEVTAGAMEQFMKELKRLRDEKVPAAELEDAKRAIVGGFALDLEQPTTLLSNVVTQKIYGLPADYWDAYPQKVAAITADDVQRVARKYLDLEHLQIIAVGDASKTRDVLSKFGQVEVFDANGKPVQTGAGKTNP